MNEHKNKNRNKKKKNNKTAEHLADSAAVSISPAKNHVMENDANGTGQVSETTDAQVDSVSIVNLDQERHLANGTDISTLAEAEKQHWLEREASLEEKIKQFQDEKDALVQNQGSLLEEIKQLQNEKVTYKQKEASLEERIAQLEIEKDACIKKEAGLEETIAQLQTEKEAHMQREVKFGEKLNHLMDEAATLNFVKVSLEEKVKQLDRERDSWMQKENSNKEVIASLIGDNSRLQSQVVELEQSRNSLLEKNQLLTENITGLQSQILNIERSAATESKMHRAEDGDVASQIEAACTLVEKLITENAELVEKVNELYLELNRRGPQKKMFSADSSAETVDSARFADNSAVVLNLNGAVEKPKTCLTSDLMHEHGHKVPMSGEGLQIPEDVNKDQRSYGETLYTTDTVVCSNSSEIMESEEIVQIPLDENERQLTDLETADTDEETAVPLSDAPLIGAPFRLISFVARYVSGTDLVEKSSVAAGG